MRSPQACHCRCHAQHRADHAQFVQRDLVGWSVHYAAQRAKLIEPSAETHDILEAAAACDVCKPLHCDALLHGVIRPVVEYDGNGARIEPPAPAPFCESEGD